MSQSLVLVASADARLLLESRSGLPVSVGVLLLARNPWFGGCPTLTVELLKADGTRLDSQTIRLYDPWGRGRDPNLSCEVVTSLNTNGHRGAFRFRLLDHRGTEIGFSGPVDLTQVAAGQIPDERPPECPVWNPFCREPGQPGLIAEVRSLLKWAIVGGIAVVAYPHVRDALNDAAE